MGDSTIIDRRLNGKNRSLPNRERFIRRYKTQLKKAVSDVAGESSISDVSGDGKVKVRIPTREVSEPTSFLVRVAAPNMWFLATATLCPATAFLGPVAVVKGRVEANPAKARAKTPLPLCCLAKSF